MGSLLILKLPFPEVRLGRQLGHCGPWVSGHNQAAMCRLPAGQPLLAVNDRLLVQAKAGPDPLPPHDGWKRCGSLLITDAGSFDPANTFVEDQQALEFCEKDLLASYRKACEDEGQPATEQEVEEYRHFELGNHVFFRYVGKDRPQSVREALDIVNAQSFWPPFYVWLNGKFHETYFENATNDDGEVVGVRL